MGEKNAGLSFITKDTYAQSCKMTPIGFFICAVMSIALSLIFSGRFASVHLEFWLLACISAIIFAVVYAADRFGAEKYVPWITVIAAAVFTLVFRKNVLAGFGAIANDVLSEVSILTGRICLDYAVADTEKVLWAMIPLLTVLITFIYKSISKGKPVYSLGIALIVYCAVATGLYPMGIDIGLLFFGVALCAVLRTGLIGSVNEGFSGKGYYIIILAMCFLLFMGTAYFIESDAERTGRDDISDLVHEKFFHSEINAMPEGNLKDLGAFEKSDAPALQITMQENQKMYLRGVIYEVYDGLSWKKQDNTILSDHEDLFYSLHEAGFYGQSQISAAGKTAEEITPLAMSIKNISACSSHGYYPYGVYTEAVAPEYMGDIVLPPTENIAYLAGSVPEWYALQQSLAVKQDEEDINSYLAAEEAYEKYITEVDLQMTNESWGLFSDRLGESKGMTLSDIRDKIRDYLDKNLTYDESALTQNGGLDFADYTLSQTGCGYNVHYATLATLMLRYYGVPARYVEGYFISQDEAVGYENGETITLTENHAHAWAEYYLPGVGFIPFEVTPGYMDNEEDQIGSDDALGGVVYVSDNLKYAQVQKPEQIEERKQDKMTFSLKPEYLLYALLAVALILLAVILRKRSIFKAAAARINSADNRNAIAMRYGYASALMKTADIPSPEGSEEAMRLNREAIFSLHEMSDDQRQFMDEYAAGVLAVCKNTWTFIQKIRYSLWDCLY
ncbi:MAG: transglutaminase domain-containing protein [Anaerofustis stercorihominis]|nr:transglutaminase domain-containing protein [Anaerofustis stercorihominis]